VFAIVDSNTLEVLDLLDERPKHDAYTLPLLSLYVTSSEASAVALPWDEWIVDPEDETLSNKVHHSGTVLSQSQFDMAVTRQDQIKMEVQNYLTTVQAMNGLAFVDLDVTQIKALLALSAAKNGWIAADGTLNLSGITADTIFNN